MDRTSVDYGRKEGDFLVPFRDRGKELGENEKKGFVASTSFLVVGRRE